MENIGCLDAIAFPSQREDQDIQDLCRRFAFREGPGQGSSPLPQGPPDVFGRQVPTGFQGLARPVEFCVGLLPRKTVSHQLPPFPLCLPSSVPLPFSIFDLRFWIWGSGPLQSAVCNIFDLGFAMLTLRTFGSFKSKIGNLKSQIYPASFSPSRFTPHVSPLPPAFCSPAPLLPCSPSRFTLHVSRPLLPAFCLPPSRCRLSGGLSARYARAVSKSRPAVSPSVPGSG